MKSLIMAVLVGLAIAGCGAVSQPTPVVTVTATPPAPNYALEMAWDKVTLEVRANACDAYNTSPEMAWTRFSEEGSNGVTEEQFMYFFDKEC